jgi:hypothetical protein
MIFGENTSWHLEQHINTYTSDPKGVNKLEIMPAEDKGNFSFMGSGFVLANSRAAINGNMPLMTIKKPNRCAGIC